MRPQRFVSLVAALTLLAAACGGDDDSADTTTLPRKNIQTSVATDGATASNRKEPE